MKKAKETWNKIISKSDGKVLPNDILTFEKTISCIEGLIKEWRDSVTNAEAEGVLTQIQDDIVCVKETIHKSAERNNGSVSKDERKIIEGHMTMVNNALNSPSLASITFNLK